MTAHITEVVMVAVRQSAASTTVLTINRHTADHQQQRQYSYLSFYAHTCTKKCIRAQNYYKYLEYARISAKKINLFIFLG